MVSWDAWDPVDKTPAVLAYNASLGQLDLGSLRLVSAGTVDTNAVTRMQYKTPFVVGFPAGFLNGNRLGALVNITYTAADLVNNYTTGGAANPTKRMCATMFIARADQFSPGVVPTPAEILALGTANLIISRGFNEAWTAPTTGDTQPGSYYHQMDGPLVTDLAPNTKYWVLVMPTRYNKGSTPSVTNDIPPVGQTANSIGRAVSVWTNRTPTAPTITSPLTGAVVSPGSTFTLTYTPNDPDKVVGSSTYQYTDVAGVQVQYAPRPTPDNPTPTWTDLPIANSLGTVLGPGWAIRDSTALPANSGSFGLLNSGSVLVKAGSNTATANQGALPGGDWQIRMRTFDYGHSFPEAALTGPGSPYGRPLGQDRALATLTPDLYPAVNTSPWSTPVNVSIPGQVPPPIPLSPINSVALPDNAAVVLTWQYRNAASPPFPQASRTVQYRKAGDTTWITLVTGAGSGNTATIAVGVLTTATEYEWRVQVTDSSAIVSNYSSVARFWLVPAPVSGVVRPIPTETIDGATLGCGKHRAFIYRRGGKRRVGEIKNFSYLDWNRVRDDISTSKIVVSDWDIDCGNLLSKLQAWAYEVVIIRENGYSKERVWEGPITLLTYERDKVTIEAKDVMGYAYRRIIKQRMSDSGTGNGTTVVNRATRVLQNVFAPDDPNILSYLTPLGQSDDAMQYRSTPAYSRTAFEEIDDMAANSGLDYTAVGRSILLWGTKHRIGTLPEFRDDDLGAPPIVSEYGMSMANRYVVSDGNGVWGEATRLDVSGNDPIYGLVEMLSSSWASDSPDDSGTYTQAGLETIKQSFAGFAERSISDRYSPGAPVVVRVPDNTTLNPGTVLSIQQLVPGVVIPLRSVGTLRKVVANQKLDSVKVTETGGNETITVTMSPFSRDDNSAEVIEG